MSEFKFTVRDGECAITELSYACGLWAEGKQLEAMQYLVGHFPAMTRFRALSILEGKHRVRSNEFEVTVGE